MSIILKTQRLHNYDTKGRVNSVGENIAGSNFSTSFTYDSYGRLSARTHPSGIVETLGYNSYGYTATISAGGSTRYTLTSMNAREQLTGATYGSNLTSAFGINMYGYPNSTITGSIQDYRYSFDTETGNLNSRLNSLRNKSEWFTYDNLDRLTGVSGPQNLAMTFNANGNVKTKSDISSTVDFGYGTNAGPYALTGVTSSTGVIPTTDQTATYTSFEKVSTLSEGVYSAAFIYNAENQRAKMDVAQSGSNILTRWYAGSSYMKETAGGVTKEYTYIGGDAYTAPVAAVTQSGTTTYYYLLRDYLGNITHQVNTSNVVVAEYNFDAWGRRRSADDWSYTLDANDLALFADRGFTGHEYLPWFNLYNMNGRMYDPLVGRFLNADPFIQDPGSTQNYNRYSYCLNNPLRYTDPTGEKWKWPKFEWRYLIPVVGQLEYVMQTINDNTPGLRQEMANLNIPDFNVGGTVNLDGNVNANGSLMGHEVFNTANRDRSAKSVEKFYENLTQVRQDYGQAWMEASSGGAFTGFKGNRYYFEGVRVRELNFGNFKQGAAMTVPGIGIFVGPDQINNDDLLKHEFGHILQYRKWGAQVFWGNVAPSSLRYANYANSNPFYSHQDYMSNWTEWSANYLSYKYFNGDFNTTYYPIHPFNRGKGIINFPPFVKGPFDFYFNWLY